MFMGIAIMWLTLALGKNHQKHSIIHSLEDWIILKIRGTNFSMSREETGRYDTLTSISTGNEYYVDTTAFTSYYIQENAE
jgi:hypothetical protein